MGWLDGLGAGLQNAGQTYYQGQMADRDFKVRQQNEALQRAFQQQQLAEQQRQHDTQQMQWQVGNTPENTQYSPEDAQRLQQGGFGAFVKQAPIYQPPEMRNAPGVTDGGGAVTAPPTQGFLSVPTEDARARSSFYAQQSANSRNAATIAGANDRASQRFALQEKIAQASNALREQELKARTINNEAARAAELQRIAVSRQTLGLMAQRLAFDEDSKAVSQEIDLYEADSRARNAGTGMERTMALISALNPSAANAMPAPAQAAPTAPKPVKPTVPSYRPGGAKPPTQAPTARRIPPPPK